MSSICKLSKSVELHHWVNPSDSEIRAGHTPNQEAKAPEKLEAKTGKLEKRLMLRQFITKALEIKRAEITELSGQGDTGQSYSKTLPSSVQKSPQKLTFYDVVQLACQQAYAEKTRRSNEDLIDLSDEPQPSLSPLALTSIQSDLALLDSCNPIFPQQISPDPSCQNEFGLSELDSTVETANNQPSVAELDATLSLNPPNEDLIELVELDVCQANDREKGEPTKHNRFSKDINQPNSQVYELSKTLVSQESKINDQPGLEVVDTEPSSAGALKSKEAIIPLFSPATVDPPEILQQSSVSLIDTESLTEEVPDDKSIASSAPPSIFSHSSSLTGATAYSLPGITEEDLQARNITLHANLKAPSLIQNPLSSPLDVTPSSPARLPLQKSPESISGINSVPQTHMNQESPSKPQRTKSDDSVSLAPHLSQISNIDEPDKQGFPWIVQAARDGNEEMVRKLLVSEADIRATHTSTRRHALAEASLQGHQRIVDLLIEEGCPLESTDIEGCTALHHACQRGHLAVAKSLLSNKALVNASGPEGKSALHLAMEAPFQNVVMLLIQHKANVNARDASFRTALHIAASQGNVTMCDHLLSEGAQLDSREAQSKTPLQLACEAGHYELVQMLLDRSKLNPTNMTFLTAFFATVEYGHVRIAESFFSQGLKLRELRRDLYKPLTLAAKSGCLAMVELIIQENGDVNARDDSGWNALHYASYHGHYQVIERLLASGVSAKAITLRKETPLLFAAKGSHFPVAERLLRSDNEGSLVSAEDERGQRPAHHVVRAGSLEIFNLLMSNGGKVNVENLFGWQPLHIATAYGHLAIVERLLQQGANVEEKLGSSSIKKDQTHKIIEEGYWAEARWPYPGSRALHLACEYGHEQIANLLISRGAKLEASCGEGWQPLHHAAYFGSSTLVETLLQGGVNPHAITNEGKTASALGFCTALAPIPEEETERIRNLLKHAMNKVKKQQKFKVALKKSSTVEDKTKLLRAAAFSMTVVSRPQLHKAKTTVQVSDPASTLPDSTSSLHRPPYPRPPYSSPLPSRDFPSDLAAKSSTIPSRPTSQAAATLPTLPSTAEVSRKSTDTAALETSPVALKSNSTTDLAPQSDTAEATPAPPTETQLSTQPKPKLSRRTTFGLAKVKPGLDMGKLSLAGMGKPTFELGKQTLDIGKSTLEIGNKTLGLGKQGYEAGKKRVEAMQGLEVGKQGLEMGKKGVDMSKSGYQKAKKFARGKGRKGKDGADTAGGGKEGGKAGEKAVEEEEEEEDGDDDGDARSEFSLGEFADYGNKDF